MKHLLDYSPEALRSWLNEHGERDYRARQIAHWVFARRAGSFEEMTDLPGALRAKLTAEFRLFSGSIVARRCADDGTEKLLLEWADGHRIECVLLRMGVRRTVCISTQVGCAMGCVFCASGLAGVTRNLTSGEILEQMLQLARLLPAEERLSHVVVMGMGEPLANLPGLLPALAVASHPQGLGISARRITISTVGLPAALARLAQQRVPYHLAVSLHAPDDALRNRLVPTNSNTGIDAIIEAADAYFASTGRRLTFEYVLLGGVNDRPDQARRLAELLADRGAMLNLIPYNEVSGLEYRRPSNEAIERFVAELGRRGINVNLRRRRGHEIDAACGQLRRTFERPVGISE